MHRAIVPFLALALAATAAHAQPACPPQPGHLNLPENRVLACAETTATRQIEIETTSEAGPGAHRTPPRAADWTIGTPEPIDLGTIACGEGTIRARACNAAGECGAWRAPSTATFRACIPGPPSLSEP